MRLVSLSLSAVCLVRERWKRACPGANDEKRDTRLQDSAPNAPDDLGDAAETCLLISCLVIMGAPVWYDDDNLVHRASSNTPHVPPSYYNKQFMMLHTVAVDPFEHPSREYWTSSTLYIVEVVHGTRV
jgi:hypothetical protein